MTAVLAELGTTMTDPVGGTQACFRAALEALSRPGRIATLPPAATAGLQVPGARDGQAPMSEATTALLLTLLDAEATVRLHGALASDAARTFLRFYTGVREALPGEHATFTVVRARDLLPAHWQGLDLGSDEAPQRGGTLVLEVPTLAAPGVERRVSSATTATALRLRGPGIEVEHGLTTTHVPEAFWRHRIAVQRSFPRGFELFLTSGCWIAALPRSTQIELEA